MKKWVLALGITLVAVGAQAQEAPGAPELTQCAADAQKANWDGVIANCKKALSLMTDKTHPGPDFYLGIAYAQKKDYANTVKYYKAFLEKAKGNSDVGDKQRVDATRTIGMSLALMKKYSDAIPYLKNAVLDDGKNAAIHYQLATAYLRTEDEKNAQKHFTRVTQLTPTSAASFYQVGRLAYIGQDMEVAQQFLGQFVALSKGGATLTQAHYLLGDMATKAGDNATAAEHFEKYMAGNPAANAQTEAVRAFLAQLKAAGG
jgi:cytochrome c-type biogenesis protein CcmH/NrfG